MLKLLKKQFFFTSRSGFELIENIEVSFEYGVKLLDLRVARPHRVLLRQLQADLQQALVE